MKILVVGAGAVGYNLAKQLSKEGHDISVVEKDQNLIKRLSGKLDVRVVSGSASSIAILEEAGIKDADMLLAVTNSDEINMVVCTLANGYGVKTKIARIRNLSLPMMRQLCIKMDFILTML